MTPIRSLFTFLALTLGVAAPTLSTGCGLAQRDGDADDDDPAVDAGPKPDAFECVDDEVCAPGENYECEDACECTGETCVDKSKWWGRDCGPDCFEIDSAFTECARHRNEALDCDHLTEDERAQLRDLAPPRADIAGTCGTNIVGWGAAGPYVQQTGSGSMRLRVSKDPVTKWYRFTRQQAGAADGSPCHVNVAWPRDVEPRADASCDAAAEPPPGKYWCWNQGGNNNLIGVGTHLGGPFSNRNPTTASAELFLEWSAGNPPIPRGNNP